MTKYILDFDDECDNHDCLPELVQLKKVLPKLKVTLFTIPMKTSFELLEKLKKYEWIQLIAHGYEHNDNYEFAKYTYEEAKDKLIRARLMGYRNGFKAPGWMISKGTMEALKNMGWWVAVQWSDGRLDGDVNGPYQPKVPAGLKFYAFREVSGDFRAIHGHTWNVCGNGILELWPELTQLSKDTEFIFVNDYLNGKT